MISAASAAAAAAGCPGGLVLVVGLHGQVAERLEVAEPGRVLLGLGAQAGGGFGGTGAGNPGGQGPGLFLGRAGLGAGGGGALGLGQGGDHRGGPDGGVEFPAQRVDDGDVLGELTGGAEGVGATALAFSQPFRVALPGQGLVQLGAQGADLPGAGGGAGGRGPGQPGGPGGCREVVPGRGGTVAGGRAGGLGDAGDELGDALPGLLDLAGGVPAAARQPLLHRAEPAGAEQPLQQFAPSSASACRNFANSPCGSSTTWKNCSADMPIRSAISASASPTRVDGAQDPPVSSSSSDLRRRGRGAGAAELGSFLFRLTGDPQPAPAERRLEADLGGGAGRGVVRAEPARLVPLAGDPAVEGERRSRRAASSCPRRSRRAAGTGPRRPGRRS